MCCSAQAPSSWLLGKPFNCKGCSPSCSPFVLFPCCVGLCCCLFAFLFCFVFHTIQKDRLARVADC